MNAYEELVYTFLQELEIARPREKVRHVAAKLAPLWDKMLKIFASTTKRSARAVMEKYDIIYVDDINSDMLDEILEMTTKRIHKDKKFQKNLSLFINYIAKHLSLSVRLFLHVSCEPEGDEETGEVSYDLRWYMFLKIKDKEGIDQTPTTEDFRKVIPHYFKDNFNIKYESP